MLAWGVSEDQLRAYAATFGLRLYGEPWGPGVTPVGRALRFRLGLDTEQRERQHPPRTEGALPYQRLGMTPVRRKSGEQSYRRIQSVCWHGHRDFLRFLFQHNPHARVKTGLADYRGRDDFEASYRNTHGQGNDYHLAYGHSCTCVNGGL